MAQKKFIIDGGFNTNADSSITGNLDMTGHIIPTVDSDGTTGYDLGSPTMKWRDLYLSQGSLYIDGQKVLESDSGTIVVKADTDQSLTVKTLGTGVLTLQSEQTVNFAATMQMAVGKKITSADGTAVVFGDKIDLDNNQLINLGAPTADGHAVTKGYVDTLVGNISTDAIIEGDTEIEIADLATGTIGFTVDGVQKLALSAASAAFTVPVTVNGVTLASTADVDTAVANLIDAAPGALDTLNELAAALGDDANFAATTTNAIATAQATAIATAESYTDAREISITNAYNTAISVESTAIANAYATAIATSETNITTAYQTYADAREAAAVATAANDATIKADAAEAAAISAAATDATTKADAAQAAAATDATTKANAAQAAAEATAASYTDARETAITTAYTSAVATAAANASADATAKANTAEANAVATASADATAKVSAEASARATAVANAVATASADATAKADTAEANAVATASADATAKAGAALASANTYTDTKVSALVDAAPSTLDTLNELAAALGDDPNFATTVTNSIAAKLSASDLTRFHTAPTDITDSTVTAYTFADLSGAIHYNVYINRMLARPTEFSVSGTTVTFAAGVLATGDEIEVSGFKS